MIITLVAATRKINEFKDETLARARIDEKSNPLKTDILAEQVC